MTAIRDKPGQPGATPNVCAIAVSYQPDLDGLASLIQAITPQVQTLIIVDNGSPQHTQEALQAMGAATGPASASGTIKVLLNAVNAGIATAQNQGLDLARACNASHVLLLDQDSLPAPDMVNQLLNAHYKHESPEKIAALGPVIVETKMVKPDYFVRLGMPGYQRVGVAESDPPLRADLLIASGCLIPMPALDRIGPMDDTLFIDRVDTEWCLRAAHAGYFCLGVPAARLAHSIGSDSLSIALLNRQVSLHSPVRHYYAFRNSLLMMFRPYIPWRWRLNEGFLLSQMLVVYLGFAPQRLARARMIGLAVWHGLTGRSGPLDKRTEQSGP